MKQWEHIARDRHALLRVRDWAGHETYTEKRLMAYLQQFERAFAETSMTVIDATEGGVAKQHTQRQALAAVLRSLPHGPSLPAVPVHPGDASVDLSSNIERRKREIRVIRQACDATLPELAKIQRFPRDAAVVNAAVAKVDAARLTMASDANVERTYSLLQQVTQQTERDRLLADLRIAASGADETVRRKLSCERDQANVAAMRSAADELEHMLSTIDLAQDDESKLRLAA